MITQGRMAAVLDHPVYDVDGRKIGDAKHVFLDDATGEPEWVSVKTGLFGTRESLVPLHEATIVEDHLEVPYAKTTVKDAPHVDVDAGGFLTVDEEHRLYEHYDIAWGDERGWQQVVDRPERDRRSHVRSRTAAATGEGTPLPYDDTTAAGIARGGHENPDTRSARSESCEHDATTRSQEHGRASTESTATGQPRLRLYLTPEAWR
ncbi:PRC-barrel domain-containing protein [Streptomyces sp. NPDC127066]|uniref:PRC-barrel domain-containing protein n=1 Tax=Streptomyces sp. NPDC127066 TaxID=3347125 RepID=UPI0036557728